MSEDKNMISDEAVEAAAKVMQAKDVREGFGEYPIWEYTEDVKALLEASAPHILESAAHDLAGADKTSHWDDLYRRFEEQDGGDLSSDSTAYLNGIADAMRFLQARANPTNPSRSQA